MSQPLKIGIIGYDTSHVPAFTRLLNDAADPFHVPGGRVVCGLPTYSEDLAASYSRVEGFKQQMEDDLGVETVDSIAALLERVDAVLLESVDGRRHLAEVQPVIAAGVPVYVDKPLAADYAEAAEITRLAEAAGCPLFSSSSLRYDANVQAIVDDPELGAVITCDAYSPATLDPTNPGLFWYGVHGVETLYTFMGAGCEWVRCYSSEACDVVVGGWPDGRLATMRGTRAGTHAYGVTVHAENKVAQTGYSKTVPLYHQLLKQIIPFLRTGQSPVPAAETLEIMAFMQAALVSAQEGRQVALSEIQGA